jgi:curved DNA-binding protein
MKYVDYYTVLGVTRDAPLEAIKKAYRKLARQYHPDVSKASDAETRFKEAATAYTTLKDPQLRAAYDQLGQPGAGQDFAPPPEWQTQHAGAFPDFEGMDLADLLAALGRGANQAQRPMRGHDLQSEVHITLEEAFGGTKRHLTVDDAGAPKSLEVTIPKGIREGQKLRLQGHGQTGSYGGSPGDLYLHIVYKTHPRFRVDLQDLYFDLQITPWEAVLGADVLIATLAGEVTLTVPPSTPSGRRLRLKGKGLARAAGANAPSGDLYAVVQIMVPPTVTAQERQLYQTLADTCTYHPRERAPSPA